MSDKLYQVFYTKDFIDLWTLLDRWKGIPDFELERILGAKYMQPILLPYEDVTPDNFSWDNDKQYLIPLHGGIYIEYQTLKSGILRQVHYNNGVAIEMSDPAFHDAFDYWTPCKIFFLKKDIENLEKENPEYLSPDNAKPYPISPTVQDTSSMRAEIEKLKDKVARQEKELVALHDAGVTPTPVDTWRNDWGFLDYVIRLIENGMSREDIAKDLSKAGFSNAIIGATTSKDLPEVKDNALRERARQLKKK